MEFLLYRIRVDMRVFDCNQDESADELLDYELDATSKWGLPGVKCPTCGSTWGTTGVEYPTVDISNEPFADEYTRYWPVSLEELERLAARIRPRFPEGVPLLPGTHFGTLTGSASGPFPDFVWLSSWSLLIKRDAYAQLRAKNVRMPAAIAPELRLPKNQFNNLLVLEILPLVSLASSSFLPGDEPCKSCGREGRQVDVPIVSRDSIPAEMDMFRPHNFPTYILATERFKQVVDELGLKGMVFQELALA
jgi:uncharacterized double-CXXCG motif protein